LTHEIEKILGIATRFLILSKGNLVFDGSPEDGIKTDLEKYGIKNPLVEYKTVENLFWGDTL
jgi:biotin transport system ATP-binding protein